MNTRAYGFITVRTNSTRLKSKCLLKFGFIQGRTTMPPSKKIAKNAGYKI